MLPPMPPVPVGNKCKLEGSEAYDYISEEKMKLELLTKRENNEYICVDMLNNVTDENNRRKSDLLHIIASNGLISRPLTSSTAIMNDFNSQSPNLSPKSISEMVTSTPSGPSKKKENEYDIMVRGHGHQLGCEREVEDDNYQIPSNLPKN
jgi:hypothetical protein